MVKLYIDNIKLREYLLIIIPILISPMFIGSDGVYLDTIMYSHYITLIPNVVFLIFCYKQYSKINTMFTIITTRLGGFKVFLFSVSFGIVAILFYSILLYLFIASFVQFTDTTSIEMTFIYIGSSIIFYLLEQFIMVFQLGNKKNILYILLPIMLNFFFHYYLVPIYFI